MYSHAPIGFCLKFNRVLSHVCSSSKSLAQSLVFSNVSFLTCKMGIMGASFTELLVVVNNVNKILIFADRYKVHA